MNVALAIDRYIELCFDQNMQGLRDRAQSIPANEAGWQRAYLQLREAIVDDVVFLEMEKLVESNVMGI